MEDVDGLKPVDILGISPIGDVISCPFDEVLELPVPDFGIQHFFHLLLLFSIDFHRWWWRYDLAGVWIVRRRFQFIDMSHGVHLDVGREVHPVGVSSLEVQVLHDPVGAFPFVVKLSGWSYGARVFGEEPYQVPRTELWCRCSLPIGLVLIAQLGVNHAGPCGFVDFSHSQG